MSNSLGFVLSADTSSLLAKMVEAGMVTEREAKKMQRSLEYVSTEMKRLAGDARAANEVASAATAPASSLQMQQQEMRKLRAEANLTANAMRQLPAQFTDVFTQLAGGQNIGLILIQQGGQIRDSFGGIIPALRGVAAMLTPVNIGIAALVGTLGATVYGFFEGRDQADKFSKSLILTHNAAGLTADGFGRMAENAAKAANGTIGAARAAAQLAVTSGVFGAANIGKATEALVRYERISGENAEKVIGDFQSMANGVAKWAAEHNQKLGFITAAKYAEIKAAEEMGDKEAAIGKTLDALNAHLVKDLSLWEKLKIAASSVWDDFIGNGRPEAVEDKLDKINAKIAGILAQRRSLDAFSGPGVGQNKFAAGDLEQAQQERTALLYQMAGEKRAAYYAAEDAARSKAAIAARQEIDGVLDRIKGQQTLNKELERAQKLFDAAAAGGTPYSKAEQAAYIAEIRKRFTPEMSPYAGLIADIQKYERQTDQLGKIVKAEGEVEAWAAEQRKKVAESAAKMTPAEQALARAAIGAAEQRRIATLREMEARDRLVKSVQAQIALEQAQYSRLSGLITSGQAITKGYIDQKAEIGLTAEELERLNLARRMEIELQKALQGVTNGADAEALYEQNRRDRQQAEEQLRILQESRREFNSKPLNGVKPALTSYFDEATNSAKKMQDTIAGSLQRSEDAFIQWAKTGKLSARDLFGYIVEQYLRAKFQEGAAGLIAAGGGASNFSLGTLVSAAASWFGNSHASGLDYVPYDGYPAILHKGERVQTAVEAASDRSGRGGSSVDASLTVGSVGSGVSRAEMMAALQQFGQAQMARIRRLQQQGLMA